MHRTRAPEDGKRREGAPDAEARSPDLSRAARLIEAGRCRARSVFRFGHDRCGGTPARAQFHRHRARSDLCRSRAARGSQRSNPCPTMCSRSKPASAPRRASRSARSSNAGSSRPATRCMIRPSASPRACAPTARSRAATRRARSTRSARMCRVPKPAMAGPSGISARAKHLVPIDLLRQQLRAGACRGPMSDTLCPRGRAGDAARIAEIYNRGHRRPRRDLRNRFARRGPDRSLGLPMAIRFSSPALTTGHGLCGGIPLSHPALL